MNPEFPHSNLQGAPDAEATLRLIARLPARSGLEDRVHAAVAEALESGDGVGIRQPRGTSQVLAWRTPRHSANSWMTSPINSWLRAAAAAAIAMVVAGGGWGVYSRVQQPLPGVTTPARITGPGGLGGFGGAGAIRTPQTLNGPVLARPAKAIQSPEKAVGSKNAALKGTVRSSRKAMQRPSSAHIPDGPLPVDSSTGR